MSRMVDDNGQDVQCLYKRNRGARSHNFWCQRKAISVTNSESMSVALDIQLAKCMSRITVSSVWLYHIFPHSHKLHDFWRKVIKCKMYVLFFCTMLPETLVLSRIQGDIGLHIKYPVFMSGFKQCPLFISDLFKLKFFRRIFEKYSYQTS